MTFFATQADIFDPPVVTGDVGVAPVRPTACDRDHWPPNYAGIYSWRIKTLAALRSDPKMLDDAKAYYSTRPAEFIADWQDTYNPRKTSNKWMPFVLFEKQYEFVQYLEELRRDNQSGLVEKCRDIGATWVACGYTVWCLLFIKDDSTGWGSRKEQLVDKLGDADSIFEKIRLLLARVPDVFRPKEYKDAYMKIVNGDNGATATGESGDNIGRGGRKAQPLHTPVLTPHGWRAMGALAVGDDVISGNGKPVRVVGVQDHGWRENYRVSFNDGTSTECDADHLWHVIDKPTRKNLARSKKIRGPSHHVLTTAEVAKNVMFDDDELNYTIPVTTPVEFAGLSTDQLPLHPYILGVLLGDGCITQTHKKNPTFVSYDPEIVDRVIELCPPYTRVVETSRENQFRFVDTSGHLGRNARSTLKNVLRCIGVADCNSHDKFIPDIYKFASIEARLEMLKGLMDTDGYVNKRKGAGKVCISLSNKILSDDVRFLVESLGGVARQTVRETYRADSYTLTINLPDQFNPFYLARKAERVGSRSKYSINRAICGVELIGYAQMRCITVDADDGLYLTNNCIVTHNSRYFVDEAAHIERPEKIEAALGDNTDVRVDISSVNGLGNVFHRRREAGTVWAPGITIPPGVVRVFIFDWRDHPEKTQAWYDQRKAKSEREGMQHIFAQEVDRNYSAAVQNTVISSEWIDAAIDAHFHIPCLRIDPPKEWMAGLDVADEGGDRNALALRQWVILRHIKEWGERDPGVMTRRMIGELRERGLRNIEIQYDPIGIGSSVRSEYNRLCDDGIITWNEFRLIPWHAGASVLNPYERVIPDDDQSILNRDMFHNMRAQAWWSLRTRFYKTWRARTQGVVYKPEELISIDSSIPLLHDVRRELAQPTRGLSTGTLRMIIAKKPEGTRSPNLADAIVQAFCPAPDENSYAQIGSYGG